MTRTGGQVVADHLVAQGVTTAFGVAGESFLPVLDAIWQRRDRLRFVPARHEATASHMAEAWGKLTGRPGVCLVTRGPGAAHAAVGVHTAAQDSTPLLLLVGQVRREHRGREAFQEVDLAALFAPIARWAVEVERADDLPAVLARAWEAMLGDRPGPVVVALPEDVLREQTDAGDVPLIIPTWREPEADDVDYLHGLVADAERPLIVVGGPRWLQGTGDALAAWAQASGVPVAAQFRRQDRIDNASPAYVGDLGLGCNPALEARVAEADLVVLLGGRFGEIPSGGYARLPVEPRAGRRLVHVHADPAELGRVWQPDLGIAAAAPLVVAGLAALGPLDPAPRRGWAAELRADYAAWSEPAPRGLAGVDLGAVVAHLRDALPADAVVANGAGNYTVWLHRYFRHRRELGADERRDGLRHPRRDRRRAARSHAHRGGAGGRRLLPDGGPRARDRGAGGPADRRARLRQRDARHDPHAPGARLPRPRRGHRAAQPGLRRAGGGVRLPRGAGRAR